MLLKFLFCFVFFVAIEYTQHLIEQKAAQEKKLEELRKEVLALKIMKSYVTLHQVVTCSSPLFVE